MKPSKDGYYRKQFTYEGKSYRITANSESELYLKWGEKLAQIKRGEVAVNGNMLVSTWAKEWLATYIKPRVRKPGAAKAKNTMTQKSYSMYTDKLDKYILPPLKNMRLKEVRDVDLQRVLVANMDKSKSTLQKISIVMKAMFRQAYNSHLILYDITTTLVLPAAEDEGGGRSLTDEERKYLYEACKIHRCSFWIRFLLRTGLRPGESQALQVKDIDLTKKLISVSKDVESGTKIISMPKTSSGIRLVPIPSDIYDELTEYIKSKKQTDFVFTQTDGKKMMTATCVSNNWRSFKRTMDILAGATTTWRGNRYNIKTDGYDKTAHGRILTIKEDNEDGSVIDKNLRLYDLRHTYCTDLQSSGVPINVARYLMGHKDIGTTSKIYTHTGEKDALNALSLIEQYSGNM